MKFKSLSLKPWILDVLNSKHIYETTDIQTEAFLSKNSNKSLIITSKTGSGKTFCFVINILNKIDLDKKQTQALILVPTKELVNQIYMVFNDFAKQQKNLRIKMLTNNANSNDVANAQVIIATPTKALDFVRSQDIKSSIKFFVLDEADMLIDFGFYNTITDVFDKINHQHLIKYATSATLHESLANHLKHILTNAKVISTSDSIWLNEQISHNIVYQSNNNDPYDTLNKFLKTINPYFCIIFANTKNEANNIYKQMLENNYNVGLIYQDFYERKRKQIYRQILDNKFQYLVATDLIARGIDIPHTDMVISFGLPSDTMWYIHRAGRIGRNKRNGFSYCIYRISDDRLINNLIHKKIKWNFYLINKDLKLVPKHKDLKLKKKIKYDEQTNNQIKKIIYTNSKKVKPGYKKKIKKQIHKIKQRIKHQNIEKKVKRILTSKNIQRSKKEK